MPFFDYAVLRRCQLSVLNLVQYYDLVFNRIQRWLEVLLRAYYRKYFQGLEFHVL